MKEENCEGCTLFDLGGCAFRNDRIPCPCQQCLVKVMCLSSCELLKDHSVRLRVHKTKRLDGR